MSEFKLFTSWGRLYGWARKNATKRGIPFLLTQIEFDALVSRSEGRCMISGIPFDAAEFSGSSRRPFAPSLDRIDSSEGYTAGNVRLVCVLVNIAMNEWGLEPLLRVARQIAEHEQGLLGTSEAWQRNPSNRRLWNPVSYVCTRDYIAERYGTSTPVHTRDVSKWARQYCEYYGIEYIFMQPSDQKATSAAYPRSVLQAVCDEMIDVKE